MLTKEELPAYRQQMEVAYIKKFTAKTVPF